MNSSRRNRRRLRQAGWNAVGLAVFVVMVFPVFWMISTAFKSNEQIIALKPVWFPLHPTLQHFADAIHKPFFWRDVLNSLIVVSVTVAVSIVIAFMAAIALARYRFSLREVFVVLVIGIQMLPQAGLIIPLYVVLARYHQVNALSGLIITYMTFVLPFCVWTLRGFLLGIPKDLEEARPGCDFGLRLHHHVERVHLRPRLAERPGEADRHGVALVLPRHEPEH